MAVYWKCKHAASCAQPLCLMEDCIDFEAKALTNADRIRAMSDKDLARAICDGIDAKFCQNLPECAKLLDSGEGIPEEKCIDCALAWLGSIVEV